MLGTGAGMGSGGGRARVRPRRWPPPRRAASGDDASGFGGVAELRGNGAPLGGAPRFRRERGASNDGERARRSGGGGPGDASAAIDQLVHRPSPPARRRRGIVRSTRSSRRRGGQRALGQDGRRVEVVQRIREGMFSFSSPSFPSLFGEQWSRRGQSNKGPSGRSRPRRIRSWSSSRGCPHRSRHPHRSRRRRSTTRTPRRGRRRPT